MLAARHRALRCAAAPAEALAASLRPRTARAVFSTTPAFRKPASPEEVEDDTLPIGYGTRLPLAIQAVYHEPLRRPATHGLPVCDLQLRSYSVRNLEFMCDFAMRAAYYANLPAFGPVPLPKKIERWTVPRGNFVHKKSQENFERVTHKRLIQIKDGNPETVELWLAFLRKHQFHGVGFKANVFNWEPLGGSDVKIGSLRDAPKKDFYNIGPKMNSRLQKEVEKILGSKEYKKLMEELSEERPTEEPTEKAAQEEEILKDYKEETPVSEDAISKDPLEAEVSARSEAAVESPVHQEAPTEAPAEAQPKTSGKAESSHHEHLSARLDSIESEMRNAKLDIAESRVDRISKQVQNARGHIVAARADFVAEQVQKARGHVVAARADYLAEQLKNARGHVVAARAEHLEEQLRNARGHIVSARAERLAEEVANAVEHISAARAAREALKVPAEESVKAMDAALEQSKKLDEEEIRLEQPEELLEIAREAMEAENPRQEAKKTEQEPVVEQETKTQEQGEKKDN